VSQEPEYFPVVECSLAELGRDVATSQRKEKDNSATSWKRSIVDCGSTFPKEQPHDPMNVSLALICFHRFALPSGYIRQGKLFGFPPITSTFLSLPIVAL
jgi:hypothetical protein